MELAVTFIRENIMRTKPVLSQGQQSQSCVTASANIDILRAASIRVVRRYVMSSCAVLWPLIALAGWVFGNLALLGVMAAFDWRRDRLRVRRLSSSSRASSRRDDGGATKARSRGTLGEEAG